jgi:hypothetical protein
MAVLCTYQLTVTRPRLEQARVEQARVEQAW